MTCTRQIRTAKDMEAWKSSPAYNAILGIISQVNKAIIGKRLCESPTTTISDGLSALLHSVSSLMELHPPLEMGNQRYGNPAFRDYFRTLQQVTVLLLLDSLESTQLY